MRMIIAALAAVLALAVAGCSSSHTTAVTSAKPAAAASAVAGPCHRAYVAWKPVGSADLYDLTTYINKVHDGLVAVSNDLNAGQVPGNDGVTLSGNLGSLIGTTLRIQNRDMPPACIPGLSADYRTITSNLVNAGSAYILYLGDANQLNAVKAQGAFDVANAYVTAANGGFQAAQADLTSFEASRAS